MITKDRAVDKLKLLVNCASHTVYDFIEQCETTTKQSRLFRTCLFMFRTKLSLDICLPRLNSSKVKLLTSFCKLRKLSKDCNFRAVAAEQYKQEMIRDAFINGLLSHAIRQRLLENRELELATAFEQARTLDLAQKNSEAYDLRKVLASSTSGDASSLGIG